MVFNEKFWYPLIEPDDLFSDFLANRFHEILDQDRLPYVLGVGGLGSGIHYSRVDEFGPHSSRG